MLDDNEWPDFSEEKCHNCGDRPGTRGCLQVGSLYNVDNQSFVVDHTSVVEDCASNHLLLLQDTPSKVETLKKEKRLFDSL